MLQPLETYEQAVEWLRQQPEKTELVNACYFDDPLAESAERFSNSNEWLETNAIITSTLHGKVGKALDIGAGRGISSYALAKNGWDVTALEPDASKLVGAGAIQSLNDTASAKMSKPIKIVEEFGEKLPFPDQSFDLVHGRQVLHHAYDLPQLCREAARVLKPGGMFIAVREHVINSADDLPVFFKRHAIHYRTGGENAFMLTEYKQAISDSGMKLLRVIKPLESEINYFPMTQARRRYELAVPISKVFGKKVGAKIASIQHPVIGTILELFSPIAPGNWRIQGRMYSFVAVR